VSVRATINVFDRVFILRHTIEKHGRSFTIGQLVGGGSRRDDEYIEETVGAIIEAIQEAKVGRATEDDFVEVFGTGGKLLGDDLSDIKIKVLRDHVDHNSLAHNDTSYTLQIEIPDSVLEDPEVE